jgi:hypothetical protein
MTAMIRALFPVACHAAHARSCLPSLVAELQGCESRAESNDVVPSSGTSGSSSWPRASV